LSTPLDLRVFLTGRVTVVGPNGHFDERDLPGNKARVALALLVHTRDPVSRERLAGIVWPTSLPGSATASINSMISHIRSLFNRAGLDGKTMLTSAGGSYMLSLPSRSWVDIEDAVRRLDRAQSAARTGNWADALPEATVACGILTRPFLEGSESDWVHEVRRQLNGSLYNCYDVLSQGWSRSGDHRLAVDVAEKAIALDPIRETAYRRAIEAEHASGDRLAALRVFDRCEQVMRAEFGASPSEITVAAVQSQTEQ